MTYSLSRAIACLAGLGWVAVLAGCAGDVNPVRDAAVSAGIGTSVPARPEFIERSRPASVEYVPIGGGVAPRPQPKSETAVKAAEAELDRTRAANEAGGSAARNAGAAVPTPVPPKIDPLPE